MKTGAWTTALAAGWMLLHAQGTMAADIKIVSSPPARPILDVIGPQFETATGHKLTFIYKTAFEIRKEIEAGAAFDLAILPKEVMDEVIGSGHVAADTRTPLARIPIGIGVQSSLPKPDITSVESFKQALLNAKSFAYTQGAMSGRHVLKLIQQLGIEDAMKPKMRMTSGGTVAVELVSKGEVEMNVDLVPEMLRWPNVNVLTPLPEAFRNDIRFQLGIARASAHAADVKRLIGQLTGPEGAAASTSKGMVPG